MGGRATGWGLAAGLLAAPALADPAQLCAAGPEAAVAIAACTELLESAPLDGAAFSDALSNRGYWRYLAEDYEAAVEDLERAIDLSPDNAEAYYHLGLVFDTYMVFDEALANFDKALALHPNWSAVLVERGNVHHLLQDYEAAIDDYVAALGQGDEDALIYANIGASYRLAGDDDHALAAHNRALELDPLQDMVLIRRGEVLERLGRFDAAIADYEAALDLDFALWAPEMKRQMREAEMWGGPADATDSPAFRDALRACVRSPDC